MTTAAPPALRQGDTIAVISPSARLNAVFPHRVARGVSYLESLGFRVRVIFTPDIPEAPLVDNVAIRAAEVHAAFADPAVRAIICTIGGMSANELLPALHATTIRAHPKIFMGSSDVTLLHQFLYQQCGLRTFYGPSVITSLGEWPTPLPFTAQHLQKVLMSGEAVGAMPRSGICVDEFCDWAGEPALIAEGKMATRVVKEARGWKWLRPGKAQGVLHGGCLPSILQLVGTEYGVDYAGKVLLIEGDFPNSGMPLERATWHLMDLYMRGIFAQIRGLIVGRPYLWTAAEEVQWEAILLRAVASYEFPVLAGVDVGHTDPMLTVPLGAEVRLDSEMDSWEVLEPGVAPRE